jgi:pyruvate kinase
MRNKVLVTLGPSSLKKEVVERMAEQGVYLFRINLSHTSIDDVESVVKAIQSWTDVPICLDSEGAQVRNQGMENESVIFEDGDVVKIHRDSVIGNRENISFYPDSVYDQLKVGDIVRVDFDSVVLKVIEEHRDCLLTTIEHGGCVGSNKAADIDRDISLNAVTDKDKAAIKIGLEMGVKNFSLSFANSAEDVRVMREIIGSESNLIAKIESVDGVLNLGEMLAISDQILIDRGDLSRQISIEKIPFIQRRIISYARCKETPVFVATNLLESMVKTKMPTRAEVNDVASTLLMGANGLVLAAETAIGKFPLESVEMINSLIMQYEKWTPESSLKDVVFG